MTKTEFIELLDGYNKDAGEFTEEEMYEIGCKYKELPVSEKDWSWLVSKLGPVDKDGNAKSGETFRIWIKSRQYADGSIKKNVQLLSGRTIEDLSFPEAEEKLAEEKRELYIQQTKTRDEHNAYRRTLRDEARIETLKDLIADSIKNLPPLSEIAPYIADSEDCAEAVLLLSDLHIGAQIDNFYNKYNLEIAKQRLDKLVDDTITYCQRNGVRRLNVVNLGDMIHGLIHISARLMEEMDVVEQVIQASELLSHALNKLQSAAPEVYYRSCLDNHSRCTANLKEHIEKENFGKLIDFYLKARLANTSIVFAEDNLDDNIGMFELFNGKKVVFAHGHQDSVNNSVQNYTAATKGYIDYVCLGHYHSSKAKTFQNSKVFVNGSIVGTDDYAMSHRLFGTPEQTLLLFEGQNLVNISINLEIK